jgi:hypothetical protein
MGAVISHEMNKLAHQINIFKKGSQSMKPPVVV